MRPNDTGFMGPPTSSPRQCPICDKEFGLETAYKRHVSYCRRAQAKRKGRPVSCAACSSSKIKCSFTKPRCARCESRSIECVYNEAARKIAPGRAQQQLTTALPAEEEDPQVVRQSQTSSPDRANSLVVASGFASESPDITIFDADNGVLDLADVDLELADLQLDLQKPDVGEWFNLAMSHNMSPTVQHALSGPHNQLGPLRYNLHQVCHTVELAFDIMSCFPQMMLRNQTLPPFMHIPSYSAFMPERISTCRGIAQVFETRTNETASFLWRTVDAEVTRIESELSRMDIYSVQHAIQCVLIYSVMLKIDYEPAMVSRGLRLVQTYWNLTVRCLDLTSQLEFFSTEKTNPSPTWEDWIVAETRRRIIAFWFIMRQVMASRLQVACGIHEHFDHLPLISPKSLWEARTREEWEIERTFHAKGNHIATYGELARAKLAPDNPVNRQRLKYWEAGTDKLGTLVNLSITLL
ncbi:unnamed protein product [Clonostachys rosea f. rosea IK726]|uniref:Uncharacterized protein n=1 Tax=Clonostachys rosea f. rosea IK726 TaxID=1349383 RepID=A0ACA9U0S9_BIOOC|nr:unnamed protein product [Clonostachys rosea f. rosea IK726]